MQEVERVWRRDFASVIARISEDWLITLDDGFVGILPEHRDHPVVVLYHNLACIGYARGWL